jgi:hypothetical protein
MVTTGGIAVGLDLNDEDKTDSLYHGGVTGFNPDIQNTSGAYWEPAAELKWYKNANNVLFQEKKELQLEVKVYKKIIKKLLKKQ